MGFSKECTKCGRVKWWYQFYWRKDRKVLTYNCKDCRKKRTNTYYHKNRIDCLEAQRDYVKRNFEKVSKQRRAYSVNNKEHIKKQSHKTYLKYKSKILANNKKYRLKNKEAVDKQKKEYARRGRHELADFYIKRVLFSFGFKTKDMSPELIEMKRQQLKLFRALRGMKNDIRSRDSGDSQAA